MKKIITLTLIILLISFLNVTAFAYDIIPKNSIALHIGSPLILSEGLMKTLDSENPDVVPFIHKERTLVPLRAISEHFGATVSYNSIDREASISFNNKTYIFPINKNFYRIEEEGQLTKTVTFDTEALIVQNRTMVPLRVICEDIIEKKVGYSDKVITIGTDSINLDSIMVNSIKNKIGQAIKLTSISELNHIMKNMFNYSTDMLPLPSTDQAPVAENDKSTASMAASDNYSSTNEQVAGVNEADIIKTDGKFIYISSGMSVKIYLANAGNPVLTDEITMKVDPQTGEYVQLSEMFIDNNRLVVLGTRNRFYNWIRPITESDLKMSIMPYRAGSNYTYCGIYSIDDKGKVNLIKELEVEGSILSSRKKDNIVYIVVNKYLYDYGVYSDGLIPMFRDSTQGTEFQQLPIDKIMYYPQRKSANYLIVAAIDIQDIEEPASINAFLGSGNLIYMSTNALYVAGQDYNTIWGTISNIAKFNVNGTKIGFAGGGLVEGTIQNQFSMDEYEGNLRVATTNWQQQSNNALYILDSNLNQIGLIKNIAPGEKIYSARFMGTKGYIVTFRQIDPLFVLDLSNPYQPVIAGELKVPGFSNYLHLVNENVLLGIGQDIDEKTGMQQGIKLSTFDVSDQGKPKEINNLILGSSGSYAEVLYNHKSLMLNLNKNMIAFDATLSNVYNVYAKEYFNGAVILQVLDNGEISLLKQISNEGIYASYVKRIIYIDDILYYILDDNIRAFDMNTFIEIK